MFWVNESERLQKGTGKMFKRLILGEVQDYNGQQNKGSKILGREETGFLYNLATEKKGNQYAVK